jgi:hypothetical protein
MKLEHEPLVPRDVRTRYRGLITVTLNARGTYWTVVTGHQDGQRDPWVDGTWHFVGTVTEKMLGEMETAVTSPFEAWAQSNWGVQPVIL